MLTIHYSTTADFSYRFVRRFFFERSGKKIISPTRAISYNWYDKKRRLVDRLEGEEKGFTGPVSFISAQYGILPVSHGSPRKSFSRVQNFGSTLFQFIISLSYLEAECSFLEDGFDALNNELRGGWIGNTNDYRRRKAERARFWSTRLAFRKSVNFNLPTADSKRKLDAAESRLITAFVKSFVFFPWTTTFVPRATRAPRCPTLDNYFD